MGIKSINKKQDNLIAKSSMLFKKYIYLFIFILTFILNSDFTKVNAHT